MKFQVKLLTKNSRAPERSDSHAAGYDLYASEKITIDPRGKRIVPTGVAISMPSDIIKVDTNYKYAPYMRIAPRSGLAGKNCIDVGAGVIDFNYRGEIKVVLFNHSDMSFTINIGDRIAQMIPTVGIYPVVDDGEFEVVESLSETDRGSQGFGSTGK